MTLSIKVIYATMCLVCDCLFQDMLSLMKINFHILNSHISLPTVQSSPSFFSSTCAVFLVNTKNTVIPSIPGSPSYTPVLSTVSPRSQSITASTQASFPPHMAPDISISSTTFNPDNLQVVQSIPSLNLHPMQTKSKSGINKHKAFLASIQDSSAVNLSLIEPATYKSAIKAPVWL